jgi:hypothetical protein
MSPEELAMMERYYGGAPAPGDPGFAESIMGQPPVPVVPSVPEIAAPPPPEAGPPLQLSTIQGDAQRMRLEMGGRPPAPAPAPEAAPGPTPDDDAEFARFMAQQEAPSQAAAPQASPAPMRAAAPRNPDPFGVQAARAGLMGTYDEQRESMRREATAREDSSMLLSEERKRMAREQEEDAAIARLEQEQAQESFDEQMGEVKRQLDDVKSKKIDPTRLMRDDGMALMSVLGGLLGGLYQGIHGLQSNPFLDQLNKQIDRDIAAQQAEIDNARTGVNDRMNLLSQQRAMFKDTALAKLQARNLYYEAAKESLAADAMAYEGRIEAERAEQGIALLSREQATLQTKIAEDAKKAAAAKAAAQAAHARAERKELRGIYKEIFEKTLSETGDPARAEYEAHRQSQELFVGASAPRPAGEAHGPEAGMSRTDRSKIAKEKHEAQAELNASLSTIDQWKDRADEVVGGTRLGSIYAKSGLPFRDSAQKAIDTREAFNRDVDLVYDAAIKAAQGGVPTAAQKDLAKTFYAQPGDSEEMLKHRIKLLKDYATRSLASKGAAAPETGGVVYRDAKGKPVE